MKKAVHQGKYLESEKAIEANGAIRDVAEACGYGKATAVRVSSYRPLVCKRLVRCRYEYTPNTGSWRTKRYVVETCRQDAYYGSNFHEIARSP